MNRKTDELLAEFGLSKLDVKYPEDAAKFLTDMTGLIERKKIRPWLDTPVPAFQDRTPKQLLKEGDMKPLSDMVYYIVSGQPG